MAGYSHPPCPSQKIQRSWKGGSGHAEGSGGSKWLQTFHRIWRSQRASWQRERCATKDNNRARQCRLNDHPSLPNFYLSFQPFFQPRYKNESVLASVNRGTWRVVSLVGWRMPRWRKKKEIHRGIYTRNCDGKGRVGVICINRYRWMIDWKKRDGWWENGRIWYILFSSD